MQIKMSILFIFFCLKMQAQTNCAKYDMAMDSGYKYLNKRDYDKALTEFQAAQIAARECGIAIDKPAAELKKVFEGLKSQRDEADSAKKVALKSAIETKSALNIARDEKQRADSALAQANKLINAFYFYDGKLALALKEVQFIPRRSRYILHVKRYGFINKEGRAVIDYKYEKAEQFDYTGFAKVKKNEIIIIIKQTYRPRTANFEVREFQETIPKE